MENNISHFIKADDNKAINLQSVLWIKKMGDCLELCSKQNGCLGEKDTHKICKFNTEDSFNKLQILFI